MDKLLILTFIVIGITSCVQETAVVELAEKEDEYKDKTVIEVPEVQPTNSYSFSSNAQEISVNEGERKDINISLIDGNGKKFSFETTNLPDFVSIETVSDTSIKLKVSPNHSHANNYNYNYIISATDEDGLTATISSVIQVNNVPQVATFGSANSTQLYRYNQTEMAKYIKADAVIEKVYEDITRNLLTYTEGPLWLQKQQKWIFTDATSNHNRIYEWTEAEGMKVWLENAGYNLGHIGVSDRGANGVALDNDGNLIVCRQGAREISKLNTSLDNPSSTFVTLANATDGKKFNSPNDITVHPNGNLYFTDPNYGLPAPQANFMEYNNEGVFLIRPDGTVVTVDLTITKPNGLGLSKNGDKLYVASSDGGNGKLYVFDIAANGTLSNKQTFFDPALAGRTEIVTGGFDGLEVNSDGVVFATGSSGVVIINPNGNLIGYIELSGRPSNIAFNEDESEILITFVRSLYRVILK